MISLRLEAHTYFSKIYFGTNTKTSTDHVLNKAVQSRPAAIILQSLATSGTAHTYKYGIPQSENRPETQAGADHQTNF